MIPESLNPSVYRCQASRKPGEGEGEKRAAKGRKYMISSKIKSRTTVVLFMLAAVSAASVYVFQNKVSAAGFQGKIFTTTFDGQTVGQNHYSSKDAVYLAGGPQNQNHSLPDGSYYFQVTGPGGMLLR